MQTQEKEIYQKASISFGR